jgi:hypothetical protein
MAADLQTFIALGIVALTVVLLARSFWKQRKNPGCGGSCGCPTDKFKTQLTARPARRRRA